MRVLHLERLTLVTAEKVGDGHNIALLLIRVGHVHGRHVDKLGEGRKAKGKTRVRFQGEADAVLKEYDQGCSCALSTLGSPITVAMHVIVRRSHCPLFRSSVHEPPRGAENCVR